MWGWVRPPGVARAKEKDLPRFQLYHDGDVIDFPDPEWTIDGILPADSLAQLYGSPDGGKTFLAVDISLCVANGQDWGGRRVRQGPVVYVFGEGRSGIKQRVAAWKEKHGLPAGVRTSAGVYFLPSPVQLLQPKDVTDLLGVIGDYFDATGRTDERRAERDDELDQEEESLDDMEGDRNPSFEEEPEGVGAEV